MFNIEEIAEKYVRGHFVVTSRDNSLNVSFVSSDELFESEFYDLVNDMKQYGFRFTEIDYDSDGAFIIRFTNSKKE